MLNKIDIDNQPNNQASHFHNPNEKFRNKNEKKIKEIIVIINKHC